MRKYAFEVKAGETFIPDDGRERVALEDARDSFDPRDVAVAIEGDAVTLMRKMEVVTVK